ncbi:hypothetical protein M3Y95_01204100 [Aphelenchoides besseyi]|nr:hypothetical protein M3Y95_01204100 [Aphelenchoides besseyi]
MNSTENDLISISSEILKVNYILGFSVGILFNSLLIFLILKRSPTTLRPFQPVVLIAAIADVQLTVLTGFTQVDRRTINSVTVLVLNGPANLLPEIGQWIAYALLTLSISSALLVLLFENAFRYWFLKTRNSLTTNQLVGSILIILFLSFGQLPVFLLYYFQSAERRRDYNTWWPEHEVVIGIDVKNDVLIRLLGLYRAFIFVGVFVLAILIGALSVWEMKKNVSSMSNKTKDLLNQYTNMLVTRVNANVSSR